MLKFLILRILVSKEIDSKKKSYLSKSEIECSRTYETLEFSTVSSDFLGIVAMPAEHH
jgi:hypothetical protein